MLSFHVIHITHNHQCNLKCDGILKHPKIQSGTLLEFIQAVYQCISVNVQLTRSLGYIQAILEEFIDGDKCLLIEVVRRFVIKDLTDKHLTQRNRQLVDQSSDSQ